MLRLENIKKNYKVADTIVEALKGINLSFRKNEFVSILGPSGCGKTTLLNIVGGLDKYTSGDLYINGKSTKDFNDYDWDVYRNHRIGFIFQSYNLIPHQTILGNVELALTIAGLSKEERIAKAKKAIDRVGLAGQYNKKPNQLSGGQCQRVAIARALVNEPEILLADEPTGALDTQTSIQIMDLIKEISKEKLVIMVTHNPDLAKEYSTRIVRLLDGLVLSDSNPFTPQEEIEEVKASNVESKVKQKEKAKMSLWTAFKLSLRNLLTKKTRTALTCVAGSIGIIGVSCVLAVSSGVRGFITSMQDDMLSGNPVTITETAFDLSNVMSGMSTSDKLESLEIKDGYINVDSIVEYLLSQSDAANQMQVKNNVTKEYIEYIMSLDKQYAAAVTLDYGLDVSNNIYTDFKVNLSDSHSDRISVSSIKNIYTSVLKETDYASYASYITNLTNVFSQAPNDSNYILSQYDLIYGDKLATAKNEIMIVVSDDQELTDLLMAHLGYYSQEEFINTIYRHSKSPEYNPNLDKNRFSYEEIVGKTFTWYPNDTIYKKTTIPLLAQLNPFTYNYKVTEEFENGMDLKVVGVLKPKANISYGCLQSGFFYTEALSKYIIQNSLNSELVKYFIDNNMTTQTSTVLENGMNYGITYNYEFQTPIDKNGNTTIKPAVGFVGETNMLGELIGMMPGANESASIYQLSLRHIGGCEIADTIKIYPVNFELKKGVIEHLDAWNSDDDITFVNSNGVEVTLKGSEREKITYMDTIALVIDLINGLIDLVTTALISFTALSLVVSCFMIAIITYVSVVERVKEIGVIRSLGGSKKDVTHLFNAETLIIGLISGIFGIGITYGISAILNLIVKVTAGIDKIAALPLYQAGIMIIVSITLTVVSGLIPSKSAAKKDPVVALRTE